MTLPPLPDSAIDIAAHATDWRAAVELCGEALRRSGATSAGYTGRMVQVIEEFGAYIVIAPGLALAHAKPGPDVLRAGLSVVTLAEPVAFGHPHNDPVLVLIGLAVKSSDEHLHSISGLANVFNDDTVIPALAAAPDADTVRSLLGVSA